MNDEGRNVHSRGVGPQNGDGQSGFIDREAPERNSQEGCRDPVGEAEGQVYNKGAEGVIACANWRSDAAVRKAYLSKYSKAHRAKQTENRRLWVAAHPEQHQKHREALKARLATEEWRLRVNATQRRRYNQNLQANIALRLRASLTQSLRRARAKKNTSIVELIGCSTEALIKHLEEQFLPGMTWERRREIHIDHIRPVISFDLTDAAQQRECFHYTNLRPMWAVENHRKGDKWEGKLTPEQRSEIARKAGLAGGRGRKTTK